MSAWNNRKRTYTAVTVTPTNKDYVVQLDARPLRTPAGRPLALAGKQLAEAIAGEWHAQGDTIAVDTMPLTRLAATAIDRIEAKQGEIVEVMLAFAGTDLLCYRADGPADLVERQMAVWQPLLDWARDSLGAGLRVTEGVVPIPQPAMAMDALRERVERLDVFRLTAVSATAAASGSLVVAFALEARRIGPGEAADAALLDEEFRMTRWGADEEAQARHARVRADIAAAAHFLELLDAAGR